MIQFQPPWHLCSDKSFETELLKEVSKGHVLFGLNVIIIAKRQDLDDFLFKLNDGRYANVHLTWARETNPIWPDTEIYESEETMHSEIQKHIDEWNEIENT